MDKNYGKKERSRRKLMHVAKGLYEKNGIENVTFHQIAEEAEMCRSTVFNHFASSKELMYAIYEQGVDDVDRHCNELGLKGEAYVREFFYKLLEDSANYPMLSLQLITNAIVNRDGSARINQIEKRISKELQLEEEDTKPLMIMGMYYGVLNHYLVLGGEVNPKKMQEQFEEMLRLIL